MNISLNGQAAKIPEASCVTEAVRQSLCAKTTDGHDTAIPSDGLAVAVNGQVVPRSSWDSTTLREGDAVDVLTAFVGG